MLFVVSRDGMYNVSCYCAGQEILPRARAMFAFAVVEKKLEEWFSGVQCDVVVGIISNENFVNVHGAVKCRLLTVHVQMAVQYTKSHQHAGNYLNVGFESVYLCGAQMD